MTARAQGNGRRRLLLMGLLLGAARHALAQVPTIEVWKAPTCGCCKEWVDHMRAAGFEVTVHDVGNGGARARLGMPAKLGSCHTARVGGYAIEGHVPSGDVKALLSERPNALGLAVPGMPLGSPGMEMDGRRDPYDVLLVARDGSTRVFRSYR